MSSTSDNVMESCSLFDHVLADTALEKQVCMMPDTPTIHKTWDTTPRSCVSQHTYEKRCDRHQGNDNEPSQMPLIDRDVTSGSDLSECVGAQDNTYHTSSDTSTFEVNRMNKNMYPNIVYIDWDNNFDEREVNEKDDSTLNGTSSGNDYISCHSANEDTIDGLILGVKEIMSRQRTVSIASLDYYRSPDTNLQITAREELQSQGQDSSVNRRQMQQSRRLPFWLWFIIAQSLGIKLHAEDKPVIATILYTLTFMSALGYFLSDWWFTAYDIVSDYTKTTVVDGAITIFFTLLWGALAVYANNLAYRLFSHRKFLDMLRLHSKTILKMNASVVLFTLMLLLAICNDLNAYPNFKDETCHRGIRRFMQALEQDARVYESRYMGLTHGNVDRPVLEEYSWVDEDYMDELRDPGGSDMDSNSAVLIPQQRSRDTSNQSERPTTSSELPSARVPPSPFLQESLISSPSLHSLRGSNPVPTETVRTSKAGSVSSQASVSDVRVRPPPLMSNSEILFRYWKIQARLRLSSVALQRWMMSVICLVVMWLAMNLVLWLNYNPALIDLANFFLPLSLLPLLSSAYAEVNQEGIRLLKFICPLEERLQMLYVLQNAPLEMTVYGFSLSYSTITTAAFGILLAFASKVLIQELSGPVNLKTG
ncbi:uncharacterized protein [Procambarus clarkii]|uniref:uncharacterized protein isoform X2 n=1 Tax=Procambarus clarkii TaxID=6728 RepID=UPI00374376A5